MRTEVTGDGVLVPEFIDWREMVNNAFGVQCVLDVPCAALPAGSSHLYIIKHEELGDWSDLTMCKFKEVRYPVKFREELLRVPEVLRLGCM